MTKSNNPSYVEMFCQAVEHVADRKGSSRAAVVKYMLDNFDLTEGGALNAHLKKAIGTAIKENKIQEVSGRPGLNGKWKLVKDKPKSTSRSRSKTASKSSSVKTSSASPKKATKKVTTASKKAAPKSPKSPKAAKSPKKKPAAKSPKSPKSKTASKKKSA